MERFIDKFDSFVKLYPNKVVLRDEFCSVTYQQLDDLSGRVYSYLLDKGLGREDFVMIALPRGVNVYIAEFGVLKAGAAFVIQEEGSPQERFSYIKSDCHCKFEINSTNWDEILATPFKEGHKNTNLHDAAFACYTSGSSGKPKGVLHEYGKLEICGMSMTINGVNMMRPDDNFGITVPQSSTAEVMFSSVAFYSGTTMTIIPMRLLNDIDALGDFFDQYHITITAFPPSLLRKKMLSASCIRWLVVGSEPVKGMFTEEYPLYNLYCQSECAITVTMYHITEKLDNAPIGTATDPNQLKVVDDFGKELPYGELGELCYATEYTRGYINLPDLTTEIYRDGWCYTGDLARMHPSGIVTLVGRKTDMIKINGVRIEPAEIEAAVKQVLHIDWAFAKGFIEPDRSYICVYYTADVDINYAQVREELLQLLPTAMIPSYFIHLDVVPQLPNGKVDKQALKAPAITDCFAEYVAPTNPMEEKLCIEMARILKLPRIGINDDFYLLGGDSLNTIQLANALAISDLSILDIYASRTPRAIADVWMEKQLLK